MLIGAGLVSLTLGAVGVLFPVMPTTPFVLLAAACFANSSPKFYGWLNRNRVFGPYLRNYRSGTGIPRNLKIGTLIFLWVGLVTSAALIHRPGISLLLAAIGTAVTIHVLTIKPRRIPQSTLID